MWNAVPQGSGLLCSSLTGISGTPSRGLQRCGVRSIRENHGAQPGEEKAKRGSEQCLSISAKQGRAGALIGTRHPGRQPALPEFHGSKRNRVPSNHFPSSSRRSAAPSPLRLWIRSASSFCLRGARSSSSSLRAASSTASVRQHRAARNRSRSPQPAGGAPVSSRTRIALQPAAPRPAPHSQPGQLSPGRSSTSSVCGGSVRKNASLSSVPSS